MTDQLPPVDARLRRQLARRSAGALPSTLLADTLARLDERPPRRWAWPSLRAPRAIAALGSIAVVAIVAVALVLGPSVRNGPPARFSGYPTDRALSTAELAELMSGPALPVNAALVASVTIESGAICPWTNQYLIGVVEGISPAVCVEERRAVDYLGGPMSGTYAFRYLGPGDLGLVGKVTAVSSHGLAFGVADEWPAGGGGPFLVRGYLGATPVACTSSQTPNVEDVLFPPAIEECEWSWLSDDGSAAPLIPTPEPAASPTPRPESTDTLTLHGKARHVAAGGARQVDSIPLETTLGTYIVDLITGPCPNASPVDSYGCPTWRILARLAELSTQAAPTPAPTVAPTRHQLSGYPADRALTTAELADLMSGPTLATNTTFVASVTIDKNMDVCPMNRAPTIGLIEGMHSQVCAMAQGVSDLPTTDKVSGIYVFQYWAPGVVAALAQVTPASSSRLAFHAADTLPTRGKFLLDAWIGRTSLVGNDPAACPAQTPDASGNIACSIYWVSDTEMGTSGLRMEVQIPDGPSAPQLGHGVFLISGGTIETRQIEARLSDDPFAATATPAPTSSPSQPPTEPTTPRTGYPFDRALGGPDLAALLAGGRLEVDSLVLAKVVLVPKPGCSGEPGNADGDYVIDDAPQVCVAHVSQKGSQIGGTFVLLYRGGNKLLMTAPFVEASYGFVFGPNDAWPTPTKDGQTFLVDGYLVRGNGTARISSTPGERTPNESMSPPVVVIGTSTEAINSSQNRVFVVTGIVVENGKVSATPVPQYNVTLLADITIPAASSPSPAASPLALPTGPAGAQPVGLWGQGNRPFTVAELPSLWAVDPQHLAGRIVIVKGPVPAGFSCWSAGQADAGISAPPCHIAVEPSQIAEDGRYWAVKVGPDGRLAVVGELSIPTGASVPGGFIYTAEEARAANLPSESLAMVYANYWTGGDGKSQLRDCGSGSVCEGLTVTPVASGIIPVAGTTAGGEHRWLLLVRVGSPWSILSRFDPVQP